MNQIIPVYLTQKPINAIMVAERLKTRGINAMVVCDYQADSIIYVAEDKAQEARHILALIDKN